MISRLKNNLMANKKLSISYLILSVLAIIYFNYDLIYTVNTVPEFWKNIFLVFSIAGAAVCFFVSIYTISEKEIHKQFMILSIVMGMMYLVVVPLMRGTDDFSHFYKVVELSEGNIMGTKDTTIPTDFKNLIENSTDSSNIMDKLFKKVDYSQRTEQVTNNASLYAPAQYIPQVLGFWVARLLQLGPYMYGLLAKLFNLIYFVICSTIAIKLMPFKKQFLFILLLSPAVLSLVGTMTCDSVIISTSMLFIAYIFNIKYNNLKITNKNILILLVLGVIIALSKSVYAPICGVMLLLIDKKTDKKTIIKIASILVICAIVSVGWYLTSLNFADKTPDVSVMEKRSAQINFVKNNIVDYIFINARLFINDGYYYISNLVGGAEMCYGRAQIPTLIVFVYLLILIRAYLSDNKNIKLSKIQRIFITSICIFIVLLSCLVMYTEWTILFTEVGGPNIVGVQSRYFVALMPIVMVAFCNKKEYKLEENSLLMPCTYLNMCTIMSIFIVMMAGRFVI